MGSQDQDRNERRFWERVRPDVIGERKTPCPDANALAAYVDEAISKERIQDMEDHLASCPDCLDALCELRALRCEEPVQAPPEVVQGAKDLIAAPVPRWERSASRLSWWLGRPHPSMRYSFRLAAVAGLILVACITGAHLGRSTKMNLKEIKKSSLAILSFEVRELAECDLEGFN